MRFQFEQLELRRMLTTIPLSGGILNIFDVAAAPGVTAVDLASISAGDDFVEVILNGSTIQVRNAAGTVLDSRSSAGVTGISINSGGGNDTVRIGTATGASMPNLPVTIHGGTGNDTITGGNLNDQLFGDDGNDRMDGRAGADLIDGGTGFDTADYSYRVISINVTLDGVANDGSNAGSGSTPGAYNDHAGDNAKNIEAVLGGSAADNLTGGPGADWLDGGGGNDTIHGGDGIDTMFGGVNADLAYGEGGDDYFFFQDSTADQFLGGTGTTFAQYDTTLDTPAPAPPALAASSLSSVLSAVGPQLTGNLVRDDSFGGGAVLTQLGGLNAKINDVTVQSVYNSETEQYEDKIIAVGTAINPSSEISNDYDALVIRYNADGTLDKTFGPDNSGFSFTDFSDGNGASDSFSSVVVNPDGQIIAAGTTSQQYSNEPVQYISEYAIARFNENGVADGTFGSGGQSVIDPNFVPSDDQGARVAIQMNNDGLEEEYVLVGTMGPQIYSNFVASAVGPSQTTHDWGMIRVTHSGNQDYNFGDFGLVTLDNHSAEDYATGLAIDPELGNIWVSGYTQIANRSDEMVAGYDDNGNEIPGALSTQSFATFDYATASVISGSQLLVVGTSKYSQAGDGFGTVAAYDIDPSSSEFAQAVNWTFVNPAPGNVALNGVTLDGEGHGIAVGSINPGDFFVWRFNTSDLSQSGNPITADFSTAAKTSNDAAFGVVVQSDGGIVVAGVAGDPFAALVRFQNEVAPPPPPPFVDVTLSPQDVQNFQFTYLDGDGNPQPVPDYLVQRIKALQPDGTFAINGTPGPDVICVSEKDGIITASINGFLWQENASQVTGLLIHGLGGDDQICIDCSIDVPATIYGDDGNDTAFGSKQGDQFHGGNGNDIFFGLGGDDVAYGDDGCDVLVGGAGNDSLFGGNGRDLLIGGRGRDFLRGGAGEDIVIGGFTLFDDGCSNLLKLIQEWNCNDNRSRRLGCLGGTNGGFNASIFLRNSGCLRTVFDDNEVDNLGGEGDSDWFFANTNKKSLGCDITDLAAGENMSVL